MGCEEGCRCFVGVKIKLWSLRSIMMVSLSKERF